MTKTLQAATLAFAVAFAGTALADDKHQHPAAAASKTAAAKAVPKSAAKTAPAEHDHADCQMMQGGMMGKGGMGMMQGGMMGNHEVMTKRMESMERRMDMMQMMMEQMMRRPEGAAPMPMPMK